jgi:MoxR-like ATPase
MADTQPASQQVMTPEQARERSEQFRKDFENLREQIGVAVVGQRDIIEGVLIALFCSGHVLLEGVPGVGKTLLVRTLAKALDLSFSRIQFTPDLMPADITGTTIVSELETERGRERLFKFQPGPIFAQIVLADEVNRATPKTQSAMLEAMQERSVTVAGETHRLPEPFLVLATQNPVEQEGTYPLPEAQLDRFFFKLLSLAPGRSDLAAILDRTTSSKHAQPKSVLTASQLIAHQALVREVAIAPSVTDYAIRLVLSTQPRAIQPAGDGTGFSTQMVERYVRLGSSPRGAQSLVLAAKCRALMEGRFAASVEDVRAAAAPALRHRLIMNFESHAEGVTQDSVVANLVSTVPTQAS